MMSAIVSCSLMTLIQRLRVLGCKLFGAALMLWVPINSYAQIMPTVNVGQVQRLENFPSKFVDARHVDIWLPDGYSPAKHYNVLYMHDGQGLFDASTTWNKQAWNVHTAIDKLVKQGRIGDTIVVGVWNNGKFRRTEYFPQKYLGFVTPIKRNQFIQAELAGTPLSDRYLQFLVQELKPYIDTHFSTYPDRAHTFMMGSSMGGLISIYAISEYPDVFGGVAALSTHWIGGPVNNTELPLAAFSYLQQHLASPENHRIYMDHGTRGLDAFYAPSQGFVDAIFKERGYTEAQMKSIVIDGADHNERDWSARLEVPLVFLLGGGQR